MFAGRLLQGAGIRRLACAEDGCEFELKVYPFLLRSLALLTFYKGVVAVRVVGVGTVEFRRFLWNYVHVLDARL